MNERLTRIVLPPDASVQAALEAIDRGGVEIALVTDGSGRLLGTLTDGDIRRALLRGAQLGDRVEPFMQGHFTSVGLSTGRAEVLDLMRARVLSQVPILDESGRLIGLHLLREIVGSTPRPNWAVIMAGGRGKRLRPVTDSIPKPMVPVAGRPILERIVLHLVGQGFRKLYVAVHYLSEVIEEHFADGSAFGCEIYYLRERQPLGTAGALTLLPEAPREPLFVLNGDLLTQFDAHRMLTFHNEGAYLATVGFYEYVHAIPYGVLDLNGHQVVGIREKPQESWSVNAGIYILDPSLLSRVPADTQFPLPSLLEECLRRNERVGAHPVAGDWIDVGHHSELRRARGEGESR